MNTIKDIDNRKMVINGVDRFSSAYALILTRHFSFIHQQTHIRTMSFRSTGFLQLVLRIYCHLRATMYTVSPTTWSSTPTKGNTSRGQVSFRFKLATSHISCTNSIIKYSIHSAASSSPVCGHDLVLWSLKYIYIIINIIICNHKSSFVVVVFSIPKNEEHGLKRLIAI